MVTCSRIRAVRQCKISAREGSSAVRLELRGLVANDRAVSPLAVPELSRHFKHYAPSISLLLLAAFD